MKRLLILLFATATLMCYGQGMDEGAISNILTAEHVSVPGTKVSLIPPKGFDISESFNGFQQIESGSSIIIVEIPGPFSEIKNALTKPALKSKGVDLIEKQEIIFNDYSAVLIEAEQTAYGVLFSKYILTFGTESHTVMVNGMFPKEMSEQLDGEIKNSLLSVLYEPSKVIDPLEEINYSVKTGGTKLKYANVLANAVIYTVDGKVPTESEDKTSYTIASSLGEVDIVDKRKYAMDRLKMIVTIKDIKINEVQNVEINDLSGYEIIVKGINEKSGKEEQIYYVMLFDNNRYYLLMGVAEDDFEDNMDLFKRVSGTFNLK